MRAAAVATGMAIELDGKRATFPLADDVPARRVEATLPGNFGSVALRRMLANSGFVDIDRGADNAEEFIFGEHLVNNFPDTRAPKLCT